MNRLMPALVLAALSCVPASEARPPAGAGGVRLEPSAAARGEPFADGDWTVRVEKLILRMNVSVTSDTASDLGSGYGYEDYLCDATTARDLFAPGVAVGTARVRVSFNRPSIYVDGTRYDDDATVLGVGDADLGRMGHVADDSVRYTDSFGASAYASGPSVILRMRGQRGERSVSFDLALSGYGSSSRTGGGSTPTVANAEPTVEIRANTLSTVMMDVVPEVIFDAGFPFARIAEADADGDGTATAEELRAHPVVPSVLPATGSGSVANDLLSALAGRSGAMLRLRK